MLPEPDEDATRRSTRPRVPSTRMNIANMKARTYCQAYRSAQADTDENDTTDRYNGPCHLQHQVNRIEIQVDDECARVAAQVIHELNQATTIAGV